MILNDLKKGVCMKEIIFILDEDPEGGFTARSFGFSIFTQGNTIDEIKGICFPFVVI
jgi:hypothetical protein